jgi:hypothetical protein
VIVDDGMDVVEPDVDLLVFVGHGCRPSQSASTAAFREAAEFFTSKCTSSPSRFCSYQFAVTREEQIVSPATGPAGTAAGSHSEPVFATPFGLEPSGACDLQGASSAHQPGHDDGHPAPGIGLP